MPLNVLLVCVLGAGMGCLLIRVCKPPQKYHRLTIACCCIGTTSASQTHGVKAMSREVKEILRNGKERKRKERKGCVHQNVEGEGGMRLSLIFHPIRLVKCHATHSSELQKEAFTPF